MPLPSHNLAGAVGLLDGKRLLDHRRAHRRLPGLRRGPAGPGGGGRDRALGRRAGPLADPAHGPQAAPRARGARDRRHRRPSSWPPPAGLLAARWDRLDGLLHAIGFAPPDCLGSGMFAAGWDDVSVALNISAYSLKALVDAFLPLLEAAGNDGGASVVGPRLRRHRGVARLRLDGRGQGGPRVALPLPGQGARARAASGSTSWRPGPCGPWRPSPSPASAPSRTRGPTGRRWAGTCTTPTAVAKACVALFSDLFPMTTGEIVHVDGGVHAVGGSA